ncbi:MAG: hypothetical protein ACE5GA_03840, partial [Candidatus Zixiibacteriota bacterium]
TKTDNRDAFMEVTALTKEAGADVFEAYAELKPSELYKAYVKEQIPQPLRDKLGKLLIKKQSLRVTASYREKSGPENGD